MKKTLLTLISASLFTGVINAQSITWASTISDKSTFIPNSEIDDITGAADLFDGATRSTDLADMSVGAFVTYDFGVGGISASQGKILVWETTGGNANTPEFGAIDVLLSNDGLAFTSIKGSEASGFLTGFEVAGVEAKDVRSYDPSAFGASARYLKIESTAGGFDLNTVGVNATPTPEPTSTALLGIGALGLIARRKR